MIGARAAAAVILLLSEAAYLSVLTFEPRAHIPRLMVTVAVLFALYAAAIIIVRRAHDQRGILPVAIAGAVLFRLTLLPLGLEPGVNVLSMMRDDVTGRAGQFRSNLLLDDDVWRYLWDGHIVAQGGNPYRAAPGSPALDRFIAPDEHAALWNSVRKRVNHPDLPTIYPPVTQLTFLAAHVAAPGSVVVLKVVLIVFDLIGIAFLIGCLRLLQRPLSDVVLYAWNPLVVIMFAGAAHVDVIMITLLTAATYFILAGSKRAAGGALACSTLAKLSPIVLWPLFARRLGAGGNAALVATTALLLAPFLFLTGSGLETLGVFASTWDFNSAAFTILRHVSRGFTSDPDRMARIVSGAVLGCVVFWIAHRDRHGDVASFAGAAMNTLGALLVLSPTAMPWYATWPLGFAVLARRPAVWIWFSALIVLSFPMTADWKTHAGWLTVEYASLVAVAVISVFLSRKM